ncbi:chemotaxis response regulator protein-glutamate methylesterase [Zoogloea sp.]|uniref:protein-glutamate methylesterase/protein-glutamine glutaminase n=1 Tax=Zoogloea sp. TaxID=49181 RepID=UPI0026100779|nr:chemotaxis response regulator protein-glutamate methylesterase [Zoogloea sp.]MDD3352369.1 chemotaxis response regulator protein-glutamate methylesterase [Zoogloea sp.]
MKRPIRVMIVDDSAIVRQVASKVIAAEPDMEVLATAVDPLFAIEKMRRAWPDVIVLDIEMPRMDGLTFLRKLMAERPTPVVICSTLVEKGAKSSFEALAAGAVGLVTKPKVGLKQYLQDESDSLVAAVRAAARARVPRAGSVAPAPRPKLTLEDLPRGPSLVRNADRTRVVAMGTSTGGTQALEAVLTALPAEVPGIVVVQHMPSGFTDMFARRLDGLCALRVREARHGDRVEPGLALIAPGGRHLQLARDGGGYHVGVVDGPLINRHKPSVDVLFRSVARVAGGNALGIIMTGMGDDGALGLKEMLDAGAATLAEAEETCVVFGMPKEAIQRGAVQTVLPLQEIPAALLAWSRHALSAG